MHLRGTLSRDFCFWFFYESVSPQPQSIPLEPFLIFLKIRRDTHKSRCTTGINDTGGKFATGVNNGSGKFPPVSMTPVNDTGGKQWEQLSDCWQLKMNLKKKIYLYAPLPNGVQKK